jgi:hypothetical protein
MPVRTRSGSSPLRSSTARDSPSVLITSPSRPPGNHRLRRGSLGAVEAVKERARRGTAGSSELSSENELDPSLFKRKQVSAVKTTRIGGISEEQANVPDMERRETKDSTDLEDEDSAEDSDGSVLSSDFEETTDSASLLDSVANPLTSSPLSTLPTPSRGIGISGRPSDASDRLPPFRSRAGPTSLQALPPPRPISTILPISALSQAIKAKNSKAASPFESFATLSGAGDPNPLQLRIFAAQSPSNTFTVSICRTTHSKEEGKQQSQRPVTVADAIGLSLWRYSEEKISPAVPREKLNVNWWTLRMVEDGEVEYDFPPLERTKTIVSFTSNNNNRGARARSNSKPFDEFALVEATPEQFKENERLTPGFKHEATTPAAQSTPDPMDETTPKPNPPAAPSPARNPLMSQFPYAAPTPNPTFTIPSTSTTLAPRSLISKILFIHLPSTDPHANQVIAMEFSTDTYIADVLKTVCAKRTLDDTHHIFKLTGTSIVIPIDRTIESLGDRADLDLLRRRFGTSDGSLGLSASPTSTYPNAPLLPDLSRPRGSSGAKPPSRLGLLTQHGADSLHPTLSFKKWTVWRKQPMSFLPTHERTLAIDGEYLVLMPGESGAKAMGLMNATKETGKTTTIHFGNVVGAKVKGKGAGFKIVVFKEGEGGGREGKRYEFEAQGREEAREIVEDVRKGVERFRGEV